MFLAKTTPELEGLDEVIDAVQSELLKTAPTDAEFPKMVEQLDKLYKIKSQSGPDRVSKDALLAVAGNLAGIVAILQFERVHVVTSKAIGFVMKSRV